MHADVMAECVIEDIINKKAPYEIGIMASMALVVSTPPKNHLADESAK